MTIVAKEDNRNLEWRNNNKGANLLAKMGWNEGESLGKRSNSIHALRAIKRQEGLGIGAKIASEGGSSESSKHFSDVLANLQAHHDTSNNNSTDDGSDSESNDDGSTDKNNREGIESKKSRKKKSKKGKKDKKRRKRKAEGDLILAQNKVTAGHAKKMREAKFGQKSAADMACIFGSTSPPMPAFNVGSGLSKSTSTTKARSKEQKKKKKKSKSKKKDRS
uniref:G-patch domain-containing protein n=1 Tax=Craspedostauros australis TaxID=1486917 RepID=A0A6T6GWA3_9STRA|mmetsp:Transcript_297/g.811  ORF Transcript_297/g.811 Transcript_297/m.811 type:complete len:220 (+) Transcript_297:181-840(+)|eukprot:CAMPEP_0198111254 /NCGR_PEP_ID=MMETSP1442-20131203/3235_1 /TAXON_ID= /ORGANISM="Craspedostauros australis, Strain CCMP3328" /LENGTH=219 /DNA_ID=CAMNT_0043767627 /DNA_START=232 /DNA_END=891 /DNA_ORIENTATION=+